MSVRLCSEDIPESHVGLIGGKRDGDTESLSSFVFDPKTREHAFSDRGERYILNGDAKRAYNQHLDLIRLGVCS